MADSRPHSQGERQQRRRHRALNKQAHKRAKRREKIMAGLTDPFAAVLIEHALGYASDESFIPLMFVPTRQLRRRVAELNREVEQLSVQPPDELARGRPIPPPADFSPDALVDVPPATRLPRRRGHRPAAFLLPLLPMMTDQKRTLDSLLARGAYQHETGFGQRYGCPRCPPPDASKPGERGKLHVFPTSTGDLVFRCHGCGWSLDSVEFAQATGHCTTVAHAPAILPNGGILPHAMPEAQRAGYERLAIVRTVFEDGRERFQRNPPGGRHRVMFGDWALLSTKMLREIFADRRLPQTLPDQCLGRISRDVYGRWSALHLHQPRAYVPLYRLELREWDPPAPVTMFLSRWTDFVAARELILASESWVAWDLEQAVRHWPDAERVPVALLDRCTGVLGEPILPFAKVWAVARGERSARFALPFCAPTTVPGEPQVFVRRVRENREYHAVPKGLLASRASFCDVSTATECVVDMAAIVALEKDHQPLPIVLADVLAPPGIHPDTRRRLLQEVSMRTGIAPEDLVAEGLNPWSGGPYALNAPGGVTYIARAGRYWRRGSRDTEFTPISNFIVRLVNVYVDSKGKIIHQARLEIGDRRVELMLSSAVLESPRRLMTTLTRAASSQGADYPVLGDSKAKRLLPELIKATLARPAAGLHACPPIVPA